MQLNSVHCGLRLLRDMLFVHAQVKASNGAVQATSAMSWEVQSGTYSWVSRPRTLTCSPQPHPGRYAAGSRRAVIFLLPPSARGNMPEFFLVSAKVRESHQVTQLKSRHPIFSQLAKDFDLLTTATPRQVRC